MGNMTQTPGVTAPDYDVSQPLDIDFAGAFADVTPEERAWQLAVREFVQDEVLPVIDGYWERYEVPMDLVKRMAELDFLRDGVDVPGYPKISKMAEGLAAMEMSRGDGSVTTICGVQGGLALRSIVMLGSDEQIEKYAGPMARGEILGAFALTEPTHGSDSVGLETSAVKETRDGVEGYVINGEKKWIGFGSIGDISVVWARGEDGQVHGYIVPQDTPGYDAKTIEGKISLRAIHQAHIVLNDVFVPAGNLLPKARSFKDTGRVLFATRLGVAWGAVGQAIACYEAAVAYSTQRTQFGRPLAASQMVQERLTKMLSILTQMQLLVKQMTRLDEAE